jgi:hypothetical protein
MVKASRRHENTKFKPSLACFVAADVRNGILRQHPEAIHDRGARGSRRYNQGLSKHRAEAAYHRPD